MIKVGFTLAEVLITLGIIGVVAALTLPSLITKINNIVDTNSAKVFNAKLIKGLNLTKAAGDLNNTYSSTYDFLENGLGKNLKMVKVCDSEGIKECFPYPKIKYELNNGTEEAIEVKDLKTPSKLRLGSGFKDVAAFVLADGTPVIASYNLDCTVDDGKADDTINGCFAGLYDINGSRKPNKFLNKIETINGKTSVTIGDLRSFNGASLGCIGKIDNMCIAKSMQSTQVYEQMVQNGETIPTVSFWGRAPSPDMWTIAKNYCTGLGLDLPSKEQLGSIANKLYDTEVDLNSNSTVPTWETVNIDTIFNSLALTFNPSTPAYCIWGKDTGHYTCYLKTQVWSYNSAFHFRSDNMQAVCVE